MHPILLKIGPLTIYTYGFFVALGAFGGILFATREAKKAGIDPQKISDLLFYLVVSSLLGARLLYIAINLNEFTDNPLEIFMIWKGGLVFYGGFIAAFVAGTVFVKKYGMPVWKTADVIAPAIPLSQALGRIGCFSAGCCYGRETTVPWAVTFSDPASLARLGVPLHPTQIYEALLDLGIFLFILSFRKRKKYEGQLIWIYTLLYAMVRLFVEFFRGDPRGSIADGMFFTSQIIGTSMLIISIIMLRVLNTKK